MKEDKSKRNLLILSGVLALVGAISHIIELEYAPYVFSVGAAGLVMLSFTFMRGAQNADFAVKRLFRINFFTSLLLIAAAYLMFIHSGVWVIALLIYCVNVLYVSFRV